MRCKDLIAIAAEYPELETVIAKTENLTTGRRDEAAFGGGALLVASLRRERVAARRCPVEGLAHRTAIELETAVFVMVLEVQHDFHVVFVAAQGRRCQRQHDPDRVVVNVRVVAAERRFYDSLAAGPLGHETALGISQQRVRQGRARGDAFDKNPRGEVGTDLDAQQQIAGLWIDGRDFVLEHADADIAGRGGPPSEALGVEAVGRRRCLVLRCVILRDCGQEKRDRAGASDGVDQKAERAATCLCEHEVVFGSRWRNRWTYTSKAQV